MSGSLPGTWTGTDTPGEMSPTETSSESCQMIRGRKQRRIRQHATVDEWMHHAQLVWRPAALEHGGVL